MGELGLVLISLENLSNILQISKEKSKDHNIYLDVALIICSKKSSRFGYMLSSKAIKVISLRLLWNLRWLHLDESKGVFDKYT
jgi:hypothetical protein